MEDKLRYFLTQDSCLLSTYSNSIICTFSGLQSAYFLERSSRDYVVFERNSEAGECLPKQVPHLVN